MIVVYPTGMVGTEGGMVLAWSSKISLQLLHSSDNQIDALITDKTRNFDWMLSAVYGLHIRLESMLVGLTLMNYLEQLKSHG